MAVRTLKSYAITGVLLLVIGLFSAASWRTELQQRDQDVIASRQAFALASIARLGAAQCAARNDAAAGTNEVLDSLIAAVKVTKSLPPDEKVTRLVRYEGAKVDIVACPVTP